MKNGKKIFLFLFIFICVVCLSACSSKGGGSFDAQAPGNSASSNQVVVESSQKIIYKVDYSLTCDDVSNTIKNINDKVTEVEGYVSYSSQTNEDFGRFIYRVPTDKLNGFLDYVDSLGGSSSKTVYTNDVTSTYNEYQASIETLEASRDAYLKLLTDTNLSMREIIEIQDKVDNLNQQIRQLHLNFDSLNADLNYSTVTISYHKKGNQVNEFFSEYGYFIYNIGKTLLAVVLYTLPFLVVGTIIFIAVVIHKKKNKEKQKE